MVRGRGKEVQKLQLLWRHFYRASHIEDRVVGLINNQIRIFHTSDIRSLRCGSSRFVTAQNCFDTGYQFLGIKGLFHIVIGTELQSQNLIKDLALGREHDDRNG